MTPRDLGFFTAVVFVSAVIGSVLGVSCRGRVILTVILSVAVSILVFAVLEWRFGSLEEWSWQYPLTSLAYLFGPFLLLVVAPTLIAALFVGSWCFRRKII